jgi:hypothetical protein
MVGLWASESYYQHDHFVLTKCLNSDQNLRKGGSDSPLVLYAGGETPFTRLHSHERC